VSGNIQRNPGLFPLRFLPAGVAQVLKHRLHPQFPVGLGDLH
jgi:hypothetical protein